MKTNTRETCLKAIQERLSGIETASDDDLAQWAFDLGCNVAPRSPDSSRKRVAYGYLRISERVLADESIGIESQKRSVQAAFEAHFQRDGYLWGGFFIDTHVSGGTDFKLRPAARELCLRMLPGDAIIALRPDRMFRTMARGAARLERWAKEGSVVYFSAWNIEFSDRNPIAKSFVHQFTVFAEMELQCARTRTLEAKAILKSVGRPINGAVPLGMKHVGQCGKRRIVVDKEQQETIDEIVRLRDVDRKTFDDIAGVLRKRGITYGVQKRRPDGTYHETRRPWISRRCSRAYQVRKKTPSNLAPQEVEAGAESPCDGAARNAEPDGQLTG